MTSRSPLLVLAVEDDDAQAELLRRALRRTSLKAEFAHCDDEDDLPGVLAERGADVVFLDNRLVRRTGLEVLRQLREDGHRMPVVFYTTLLDDRLRAELNELGCEHVLEKDKVSPARVEELLREVVGIPG